MKFRSLLSSTLLATFFSFTVAQVTPEIKTLAPAAPIISTPSPSRAPNDGTVVPTTISPTIGGSSSPSDAPNDGTVVPSTASPTTSSSPTGAPSGSAPSLIPFSVLPTFVPSDSGPSQIPFTESPSEDPTLSSAPSGSAPSQVPISFFPSPTPVEFEDCAAKECDITDSNACSCRAGLECRQRGSFGTYLCSQIPREERSRLSDSEGVGGAAGRDSRGRIRANRLRKNVDSRI